MSFLSDAVSSAEQQISVNTKGIVTAQVQGVKGAVSNAKNTAVSAVSGAVNNSVKSAIGTVVGSAGQLLTGNFAGAAATLGSGLDNLGGSFLSGLGGYDGNALALASPGSFSSLATNNGGITPGNDLAGIQNRPDPVMNYTWYCQLPTINPGSTQNTSSATSSSILSSIGAGVLSSVMGGAVASSASASLPWYYIEGATCPFRQYETVTIFREGRDRKYPSKYNVDNLHLNIYADSQNNAISYLQAWNNTILTPFASSAAAQMGGGWGRPSDYKKTIYVYVLDVTNNTLGIIEYVECWPVAIEQYTLESGNSNRVVNRVSFSVGDVFINLMPVSGNLAASALTNGASNGITTAINSAGSLVNNITSTVANKAISSVSSGFASIF